MAPKEISMNNDRLNSRRDFVRKMALSGLATFSLQGMGVMADPSNNPHKQAKTDSLVFLFQGDSITDGNRGRNTDPNHIMGHGYAFAIASRLGADYPEKRLSFYNRGISGNKVTDLEARWQKDTIDLKPDVLSVLVGINDSASVVFDRQPVVTVSKYGEVYKSLLDQTLLQFPDVLIVLCNPFLLPVGKVKDNLVAYKSDLEQRQTIVKNLASEYHAVFVDFQAVFDNACHRANPDYWIWDGVHPTVAGHELMAREWMKQVGKTLKFVR
jgi:lysophospholipase L1-like esterase